MSLSNHSSLRTPGGARNDSESFSEKIEAETSAVQAAARRLLESTVDFPNDSFVEVLQALCGLIHTSSSTTQSGEQTPSNTGRPKVLHQRRLGSVSSLSLSSEDSSRDSAFALNKVGELASLNEERLASYPPDDSGWDVLVGELVRYSTNDQKATATRLLAADILCRTVKEIARLSVSDEERNEVQARILSALQTQISSLHQDDSRSNYYAETDVRIHQIALAALKSVIEQCGESLVAGWVSVFDSLSSVFTFTPRSDDTGTNDITPGTFSNAVEVISKTLARTAFGTIQLVCSDFLAAVPDTSLSTLLELLLNFSCQQGDLNMSLTVSTFQDDKHETYLTYSRPSPSSGTFQISFTQEAIYPNCQVSRAMLRKKKRSRKQLKQSQKRARPRHSGFLFSSTCRLSPRISVRNFATLRYKPFSVSSKTTLIN
jgi:hypothetical protein